MRNYDVKVNVKTEVGTWNINAKLEIDETKPLGQIEQDILNDLNELYQIGNEIKEYKITYKYKCKKK